MSSQHIVLVIAVVSITTFGLRAVSVVLARQFGDHGLIDFLQKRLPAGVMPLLLIYSVQTLPHDDTRAIGSLIAASTLALALFWLRRSALLSIFSGLALYLVAINGF